MTFADIIEEVESESNTITIFNFWGDEETFEKISEKFEFHNVNVKKGETDPWKPKNFAVLHNRNEFLGAASVEELRKALLMEGWEDYASRTSVENDLPDILTKLENTLFTVRGAERRILMNASRHIEERAWKEGEGVLKTGFQKLSKMRDMKGTWDIYTRIAQQGVDVHVYGIPDWKPPETDEIEIHESESEEIEKTHFVHFDGGGNDKKKGALIAEQTNLSGKEEEGDRDDEDYGDDDAEEEYHGFWTYKPEKVDKIGEYIVEEYG